MPVTQTRRRLIAALSAVSIAGFLRSQPRIKGKGLGGSRP